MKGQGHDKVHDLKNISPVEACIHHYSVQVRFFLVDRRTVVSHPQARERRGCLWERAFIVHDAEFAEKRAQLKASLASVNR